MINPTIPAIKTEPMCWLTFILNCVCGYWCFDEKVLMFIADLYVFLVCDSVIMQKQVKGKTLY